MSAKTLLKSLVKRSSRKAVILSLFSLGSLTIASPSFAASLDVGSWTRSGDVSQTPGQATLTNAARDGSDDINANPNNIVNVSGNPPTDPNLGISPLETFLGVTQGTLGLDATEGSAIKTALNVMAGDLFTFDSNFISNDVPGRDRAFVTIGNSLIPLTSNSRFSYTFTTAGNYNVGIGVVDGGNNVIRSSRLSVSNANLEPVPEPLTILGSLTALGFGAGLRQRFRKQA
jgi:hypothetical protein